MHLTDIFIRNVGPIETLDMSLPFNASGSPKPVVFVGRNGSGKSTALAQIADGLWELSAEVFDDISMLTPGMTRQYLLPIGGGSPRSGAGHSLALMTFVDDSGREIHFPCQKRHFGQFYVCSCPQRKVRPRHRLANQ